MQKKKRKRMAEKTIEEFLYVTAPMWTFNKFIPKGVILTCLGFETSEQWTINGYINLSGVSK